MKLKKIIAGIAAAAVAVSMTAVNAFAAITNANAEDGGGNYVLDAKAAGYDLSAIYGFRAQLSGDYIGDTGCGGAMVFNSENGGWDQHEWGNDGANKEITTTEDGVITLLKTSPAFTASEGWAQCVIAQYWGGNFAVDSITLLDKNGNALSPNAAPAVTEAAADVVDGDEAEASDDGVVAISETEGEAVEENAAPAPAETEAAPAVTVAETTAAPAAATTTAPTTGNVPAAVMLSVMAVAGVAAVVSKKRK